MNANKVFAVLHSYERAVPRPLPLPTEKQVADAEKALGVKFPPSFRTFEKMHSNINAGELEPLVVTAHGPINIVEEAQAAWNECRVPRTMLPFIESDGDFFCFDLDSRGPEHRVVLWSGSRSRVMREWDGFIEWVDQYWIAQLRGSRV